MEADGINKDEALLSGRFGIPPPFQPSVSPIVMAFLTNLSPPPPLKKIRLRLVTSWDIAAADTANQYKRHRSAEYYQLE